jgi:hypothetical protein
MRRIPTVFEANRGQAPAGVDFVCRCRGYTAFLQRDGATIAFGHAAVALRFDGVGAARPATAGHELPGRSNFLLGNDPVGWVTDVPHFDGVDYGSDAPGATLRWLAPMGDLRFDFVLGPGADPARARFTVEGAEALETDESGALAIAVAGGRAVVSRPVAWQERVGVRRVVDARFEVDGTRVAVVLGAFDPSLAVVVDPSLTYSTYLSGTDEDYATGVAVDSSGYAYVVGQTRSSGFPVTTGAYDTTKASDGSGTVRQDAFVTKLAASGSSLVYSTFVGGNNDEYTGGIAVDSSGNAHFTGYSYGTDYPTTPGAWQPTKTFTGAPSGFLTKLNSSGSGLGYSTYANQGYGRAVALDSSGNAYLGLEGTGAIVVKVAADGTSSPWRIDLPASPTTSDAGWPWGVAVDASGNAYVTGETRSSRFPTTAGAPKTSLEGTSDGFVTKVSSTGAVGFSTYLGGDGRDAGRGIGLDSAGQVVVAGYTYSSNFPTTTGAYQTSLSTGPDCFVTTVNAAGTALVHSTYFGGSGEDYAFSLALHPCGALCIAGSTTSTNLPMVGAHQSSLSGPSGYDAFAARFDRSRALVWSTYLGSNGQNEQAHVAMNGAGAIQLAGYCGVSFPLAGTPFQTTARGNYEAWVAQVPDVAESTNPLVISTSQPTDATVDMSYSHQLQRSGGASSSAWVVTSGSLPNGIGLSLAGLISGTPTQTGVFPIRVQVTDGCEVAAVRDISLRVNRQPTVDVASLPAWTVHVPYSAAVGASGGTGALTFALAGGRLPSGVDLASSGVVSGTPTETGDFAPTVRVTDLYGATATPDRTAARRPARAIRQGRR